MSSPRLPLTGDERALLRKLGIRLDELADVDPAWLAARGGGVLDRTRARKLVGAAGLQRLGSVGPAITRDLEILGIETVEDLEGRDATVLFRTLQRRTGKPSDPCVEDVLRCAIAQAENPRLPAAMRNWWWWTPKRGEPRKG